MKRNVLFATAVAAMALVSCNKELSVNEDNLAMEGTTVLRFGIVEDATKTAVAGAVNMVWTAGDDIAVDTGKSGIKTFSLSSGAGTGDGTFVLNEVVTVKENATSFYPASLSPYWSDTWHVTVPDTYVWSERGLNAPMISWVNNAYPYFHLLGAVIKVDIYSIPATANKLVFTTDSQKVSGDFALNASNGIDTASGSDNTITVTFEAGSSASKTFYVPVPAGTYTNCTFSVQSDSETFKTVKAASITVEKDQLFFAPAVNCSSSATRMTLWEGSQTVGASKWENFQIPMHQTVWNTLSEGAELICTLTRAGEEDGFIKPSCQYTSNWTWMDLHDGASVGESTTTVSFTLTSDILSYLTNECQAFLLCGQRFTLTKLEVELPKPERILWTGSVDLADWSNSVEAFPDGFWTNLKTGHIITVYFVNNLTDDTWRNVCLYAKTSGDWTTVGSVSFNVDGWSYACFRLDKDGADGIKANNCAVKGNGATVTKITLR